MNCVLQREVRPLHVKNILGGGCDPELQRLFNCSQCTAPVCQL